MKRKWIVVPLSFACAFTAIAAAACSPETEDQDVVDYTFEDWSPEVGDPDEGFTIDGVLDEEVYSQKRWLRAVKMEKTDGNLDYDTAMAAIEDAATIGMTTHYGTEGMYVALEYKAAVGEQLYVNPDRSSTQNSIAELYLAMPQATDIEDKYVCEVDMQPDGSLVFKKNNWGGNWDNFATTYDIMAQLGVQTNGVVGEIVGEGEQRATQYSMELFIPWEYIDKIGGEGTADLIKAGDVRINLAPITSYNYQGTDGNVDRWWWMLGSQLDDGAWGNLNGWYHFDGDGLISYDIDIQIEGEGGSVMQRFGYDYAVANNSVTFLTKAEDGYALDTITVNGVDYSSQIVSIGSSYFTVPANLVTEDLVVEAKFIEYVAEEQPFKANIWLSTLGEKVAAPEGTTVSLTGSATYTDLPVTNGVLDAEIFPGSYTATVKVPDGKTYHSTTFMVRINSTGEETETVDLTFGWDAFTSMMFSTIAGVEIDDTHASDENGYIVNTQGNTVIASLNMTSGDSVFSATFTNAMASVNNRWGIDYLYDINGDAGVRVTVKVSSDAGFESKMVFQWYGENGDWNWGITNLNPIWTNVALENDLYTNDEYKNAFLSGDGIELTGIRNGNTLYYFAAIAGKPDSSVFCGSFELTGVYAEQEGTWTIDIADATTGHNIYFSYSEDAELIASRTEFSVTLPENTIGGTVSADKTTAGIGETITVSITPDTGYVINSVTVNGESVSVSGGKLELTYEDGTEIDIEVNFRLANAVEVNFNVPALVRLGENVSLNGKTVTFASATTQTMTIENGEIAAYLEPDTYTVTLNGYGSAVASLTVTIAEDGSTTIGGETSDTLTFVYDAFTANGIGGNEGAAIDDANANTDKYITATAGGRIWAVMNESSMNAVFTATFSSATSTNADAFRTVIYTFADKTAIIPLVKRASDSEIKVEWQGWAEFGLTNVHTVWNTKNYSGALNDAYNGDGIDFTMVRSGLTIYVFLSVHDKPETAVLYDTYTFDAKFASEAGYFGIGVGSDVPAGGKLYFSFSDSEQDVAAWVDKLYFSVNASNADGESDGAVEASSDKALLDGGTITITVKTDIGYTIDTLLVNGVDRAADLVNGTLTLSASDCPAGSRTITVVASYKTAVTVQVEATVTAMRLGKETVADGMQIRFVSSSEAQLTVQNGKVAGTLNVGETYTVTIVGGNFVPLTVTVAEDGTLNVTGGSANTLAFAYDVFTQNLMGINLNSTIDDSHENDENGYITFISGTSVLAITNETFGNSVFSVTFNKNNTGTNFQGPALIFDNEMAARFCMKMNGDKIDFQNENRGDWGLGTIITNWNWYGFDTDGSYTEAWNEGKGIVWTLVRDGLDIYFFVAIEGEEDTTTKYAGVYTLPEEYAGEAHWAIIAADADKNSDKTYHFSLTDEAATVAEWVAKVPAADETEA